MSFLICTLLTLLELLIGVVALMVLLSFTVAWYERANNNPDLIQRRFTSRGIFLSLWLMAQEIGSLLTTLFLRPFGWGNPDTSALQADAQPPVILLHGLFQNRSCMYWLRFRLQKAGFKNVIAINTPPWRDLETLTEILSRTIDEVAIAHGVTKVHLVGHSMGGIIARNYIQRRGGAPRVACCVTIGSPHSGSKLAPFALSPLGKAVLPGSEFLRQLNAVDKPPETRVIAVYTRHDNIVLPATNAKLTAADINIELDGMGHTSLLFHPRVVEVVIEQLKGYETDADIQSEEPATV